MTLFWVLLIQSSQELSSANHLTPRLLAGIDWKLWQARYIMAGKSRLGATCEILYIVDELEKIPVKCKHILIHILIRQQHPSRKIANVVLKSLNNDLISILALNQVRHNLRRGLFSFRQNTRAILWNTSSVTAYLVCNVHGHIVFSIFDTNIQPAIWIPCPVSDYWIHKTCERTTTLSLKSAKTWQT